MGGIRRISHEPESEGEVAEKDKKVCRIFPGTERYQIELHMNKKYIGIFFYHYNRCHGFIDFWEKFKYLGTILRYSLTCDADVDKRIT